MVARRQDPPLAEATVAVALGPALLGALRLWGPCAMCLDSCSF